MFATCIGTDEDKEQGLAEAISKEYGLIPAN